MIARALGRRLHLWAKRVHFKGRDGRSFGHRDPEEVSEGKRRLAVSMERVRTERAVAHTQGQPTEELRGPWGGQGQSGQSPAAAD